jgi:predicted phage terminase large subunit-like protein
VTTELFPLDEIKALMPFMTVEETLRVIKLVKVIQLSAPPPKPVSELDMLNMEMDLAAFFRAAWTILEPGKPLLWSWHYSLIAEYLTLVAQKKLRRLIINVPPRTAKSAYVTKCFPVWMWLQNPAVSFLFASYSSALSTDHSVDRRNLIQSQWFQSLWADKFQLAPDRNLTTQFSNDKMGQMVATSTGSGAEGRGGDIVILDDPMSNKQALSDTERYAANRWISATLKQRLNDPATAAIIVVMQRLHEMDTTGYVQKEDPGMWAKIELPLVAEKDERWEFPISGRVVTRKEGDVLQPERFTPEIVKEKQADRLVYAGQYQQHPTPLEGNLIKRSDIKYYGGSDPLTGERDESLPEIFDKKLISVDCAFKETKTSDYVAIGVIGVKGRKRFILDIVNEHLDVIATESVIRRKREQYSNKDGYVSAILVEDKANGPAVIQRLRQNVTGVIPIEPLGGKIARFCAVAPEWQSGDWYVDRAAAWTEPFVRQITMFPMAENDDMADCMSQVGIHLGTTNLSVWANL